MAGVKFSLLLLALSLAPLYLLSTISGEPSRLTAIGLDNPSLHIALSRRVEPSCERTRVAGISRLNLKRYASVMLLSLNVSENIPKRIQSKIQINVHRNASSGLCQFEEDEWQNLENGHWSAMLSPYENKFVDMKFGDKVAGSITLTVREEFQRWRLFFLGFGFSLLLLAPIVSTWVPFYYSTSMALGVLLVILMILFQGMKLLPMGRKNILYLSLYGSLLGVGSYLAHYFSTLVNSILVNLGLDEEMHNPVSVFLLVGIILAGAGLGYWMVRKFVISHDGNVDASIALFVKWAMRVIAIVAIVQSTPDIILAVSASIVCSLICSAVLKILPSPSSRKQAHKPNVNIWKRRARQEAEVHRNIEFISRSSQNGFGHPSWDSPISPYSWSSTPRKARAYLSPAKKMLRPNDYYSTFHNLPPRKFSKKEWEDFTQDSTREALSEWASTPEVAEWLADNAHRMQLEPNASSDESLASSEDSSDETVVDNSSGFGLLKWPVLTWAT